MDALARAVLPGRKRMKYAGEMQELHSSQDRARD